MDYCMVVMPNGVKQPRGRFAGENGKVLNLLVVACIEDDKTPGGP